MGEPSPGQPRPLFATVLMRMGKPSRVRIRSSKAKTREATRADREPEPPRLATTGNRHEEPREEIRPDRTEHTTRVRGTDRQGRRGDRPQSTEERPQSTPQRTPLRRDAEAVMSRHVTISSCVPCLFPPFS